MFYGLFAASSYRQLQVPISLGIADADGVHRRLYGLHGFDARKIFLVVRRVIAVREKHNIGKLAGSGIHSGGSGLQPLSQSGSRGGARLVGPRSRGRGSRIQTSRQLANVLVMARQRTKQLSPTGEADQREANAAPLLQVIAESLNRRAVARPQRLGKTSVASMLRLRSTTRIKLRSEATSATLFVPQMGPATPTVSRTNP